jgi:hypothetical protein
LPRRAQDNNTSNIKPSLSDEGKGTTMTTLTFDKGFVPANFRYPIALHAGGATRLSASPPSMQSHGIGTTRRDHPFPVS